MKETHSVHSYRRCLGPLFPTTNQPDTLGLDVRRYLPGIWNAEHDPPQEGLWLSLFTSWSFSQSRSDGRKAIGGHKGGEGDWHCHLNGVRKVTRSPMKAKGNKTKPKMLHYNQKVSL